MQPWSVIGIKSAICDMQYHIKDDAQAAHGVLGIKLPMVLVLNPIIPLARTSNRGPRRCPSDVEIHLRHRKALWR
jgi:hypothetical protein